MSKKAKPAAPQKKTILVGVDCDTDRLYGPLPGAIVYLREIQVKFPGTDITLEENWTGYEDMEMRFSYHRLETDDEFRQRVEQEAAERAYKAAQRARETERQEKLAQFEKLRRELGR